MDRWRRSRGRRPADRPPGRRGGVGADSAQQRADPATSGEARADEERADILADRADHVGRTEPGTPLAVEVAEQSVTVAEHLLAAADTLDNRRRLARALRRRSATYQWTEDAQAAAASAQRCWALCLQLLDATATDPAAYDETVLLVVRWAGTLGPALVTAGMQADADRMAEFTLHIAARAQGPRGLQARALESMAELSDKADAFERAYLDGPEEGAMELDEAIATARDSVGVLRGHASEGPSDVADLARMLHVLYRLYRVDDQRDKASAALEEAISLAQTVADQGPAFARLHTELYFERHGDPGTLLDAEEPWHRSLTAVGWPAFRRAARDIGGSVELFPEGAARVLAQLYPSSSPLAHDPARQGALHGLNMAWVASLLTDSGSPAQACDLAGDALRQLMRFSDSPDRIQAALVVALRVEAIARQAIADHAGALSAEEQAAGILSILVRRDVTYIDDLGAP